MRLRFKFSQVHPYLEDSLRRQKLWPLTTTQLQALESLQKGENVLVNDLTGSGKTLCYLVPFINDILKGRREEGKPWGGLVLTLTKELCVQVYRQVRLLDPNNILRVSRVGSISHFSSIVQKLNKRESSPEDLDQFVRENVINTINWKNWDLVISTPQGLTGALGKMKNVLNPKLVAIDEADMLLAIDENVAKDTEHLIKTQMSKKEKVQYILASSSMPPRIGGKPSDLVLKGMFKNLKWLESPNKHKLPPSLEVQWIDTSILDQDNKTKFDVVFNILKESQQRAILFCNSADTAQDLGKRLQARGLKTQFLAASLNTHQRTHALSEFESARTPILLATNLASRGLHFDVPLVIEYEMATNVVDYLNRAGRTARFNRPGTIISFVDESDRPLFTDIKESLETNSSLDSMFSHKRSYSKSNRKPE